MDDLLIEFLTETSENLAVLDVELVKLEQNPNDPTLLSSIFRLVHTIKGTCGFLGLPRLEAVAHASENVLGRFRDGELTVTPPAVSMILRALDCIKTILAAIESSGSEPEGNDLELIAQLNAAAAGESPSIDSEAAAPIAVGGRVANLIDSQADDESFQSPGSRPANESKAPALPPEPASADIASKESSIASHSIRVQVGLLENLMTTVSELVLTRNQLLQILRSQKDSEFGAPLQRLNQVVSELQEGVMKTRMQPIGNAWGKLPRIIRDLSQELGKKIELEMRGAETELDRQVLELIKDPLTHMVRNSADHGIEKPEDRAASGKPEIGRIVLNAFHQGGHIIIEISDDGRGLNIEKIKAKVLANGLATEAELAALTDIQVQQFIFRAGLSTADSVTAVSGRGVGMDVVKTNIEKIGGTIELKSTPGAGSTFTIKIPLTLAIVSALIVEAAGERYAIPQISVVELVRATERGRGEHRIERINGAPVLRLRDRLLPLVALDDILKLDASRELSNTEERFVVVIQVGVQAFGIVVDRVFDTEEIVVKPVAPVVRHISMFSGNTILGDGSVIMILDPNGIAVATGDISVSDTTSASGAKPLTSNALETTSLLVFRAGPGGPKAVPLSLVTRLEEFDPSKVEVIDGRSVIQYRGKLMPLIPCEPGHPSNTTSRLPALVFADGERVMGLQVDEIVDIIDTPIDVQLTSETPGITGSAIVAGSATDLIDSGYYLTRAFPNWFGSTIAQSSNTSQTRKVLVVDDSHFFRNLLAPQLKAAGYQVTMAASADEALSLRERGDSFDIIVSDIEMPGMSGFDFAQRVRGEGAWEFTPVIALSSHTQPADLDRARASGFDDYVVKFDRANLLAKLSQNLIDTRSAA